MRVRIEVVDSGTLLHAGKLNLEERELCLKTQQLRVKSKNLCVLRRKLLWEL